MDPRSDCECAWLFVSVCWPCDGLACISPNGSWDILQPPPTSELVLEFVDNAIEIFLMR